MFAPVSWLLLLTTAAAFAAEDAISRIVRGERGALRALYDEYAGRAMTIAGRVLGSTAEAEELVQETFLEIWRRAPEYEKERGAPGAWIAALARSRAIDRLRARRRSDRATQALGSEPQPEPDLPALSAQRRQERDRVRTALHTLPEAQRRAIELAYFSGLTQAEIADKLGEPLGTIKTRIRTAMEKLAAMLPETQS
jgi:RNA polymerase sigma-70 factor (ECF subfamily)